MFLSQRGDGVRQEGFLIWDKHCFSFCAAVESDAENGKCRKMFSYVHICSLLSRIQWEPCEHVSLRSKVRAHCWPPPRNAWDSIFSNIVNLRMDFNLSRSPNPILQEGVSGWEENESHFVSDASGIGKSGCGLECQERRGGFMTSRTHIKSRFTLSGDCLGCRFDRCCKGCSRYKSWCRSALHLGVTFKLLDLNKNNEQDSELEFKFEYVVHNWNTFNKLL